MAKRDWIVSSGFAIAGLGAAWLIWPDQNDLVCKKTGETLSDSQFVDRAIRATLEKYPGSIHEPRATAAIVADNAIPYDEAEEFLSVNPDCCSFGPRGLDGSPMPGHSITGEKLAGFVIVRYKIKYRDPAGADPAVNLADAYATQFLLDAYGDVHPIL